MSERIVTGAELMGRVAELAEQLGGKMQSCEWRTLKDGLVVVTFSYSDREPEPELPVEYVRTVNRWTSLLRGSAVVSPRNRGSEPPVNGATGQPTEQGDA